MTEAVSASKLAFRTVTKMNGIGNAIVILDLRDSDFVLVPEAVRAIAAQPRLAFEQLMVLHPPHQTGTDAFLRIYNIDGSQAGACGNGTRCVAWFLLQNSDRDSVLLETETTPLACHRLADGRFSVDMGLPRFRWDAIPLANADVDPRALDFGPGLPPAIALSMGNPHAVFFVDDLNAIDLAAVGPKLETAPIFPDRANISFAQVLDRDTIRLKVWERGAGATLACGSAACATLVAAAETGRVGRAATIELPGGRLEISWDDDRHVIMTGPVTFEYTATLDPELFEDRAA
ncbi:diaminopimelate epimerase [Beijerinckia sp. L45]|uniref:diaminopimelate epimerase n=1 Tax=Beijerinckia sp. L45 TaxID=1641855 RepID=UPI00131B2B49|nr:diaminopimelate epimerase [Beijerinckia sp. L45]